MKAEENFGMSHHDHRAGGAAGWLRPALAALALAGGWAIQPAIAAAQGPPAPPPGAVRVTLEGELDVLYEDDDVNHRLVHFLETDNRRIPVRFPGAPPDLPSGSRIRITGNLADGAVLADGVSMLAVSSARTLGPLNAVVILFNFSNNPTEAFTPATVSSVNEQVKNFYLENTYGQTVLSFTVAGWFTIAATNATCDYYTWATQAEAAATAAGVTLTAYDRRVFAFPRTSACGWSGMGNVAGPRSWLNGRYTLRILAHELGHNFGNHHSRSKRCDSSGCTAVEYGDDRDVLGASGIVGHLNAFQKERLGWLNYGSSPTIQTVATSGDYWIENYETIRGQSKALKIWNPNTSTYYYVESRARIGFDAGVAEGVTLHAAASSSSAGYQLDMAPATTTWDSTLDSGQTFSDDAMGLSITTISSSTDGALVRVSFGKQSCTTAAPTVSLTPSSRTGAGGTSVSFTVQVTNNDGPGCTAAPFTLSARTPGGWTASVAALPTLAPGASASATLSIAIPADASGTSSFTVTARNTSSGLEGSAGGSVTVSSPVTALSVTASASVSGGKNNRAITVTVTVKAGSTSVGDAAVSVTIQPPSGLPATLSATTGGNGRASVKYDVAPNATGLYHIKAVASREGASGTATTSVAVQ